LIAASLAFGNTIFGFFVMPESLPPERRESKPFSQMFSWKNQFAGIFVSRISKNFWLRSFCSTLPLRACRRIFHCIPMRALAGLLRRTVIFIYTLGCAAFSFRDIYLANCRRVLASVRLFPAGLSFMVIGLAAMAFVTDAWMLFPAVAVVALGTGTSIPSLTALVSLRVPDNEQGRLMGGMQTLLALTNIFGPTLAGVSFEVIAITAPYWLGSLLSVFALGVAFMSLRGAERRSNPLLDD
jgi:MFS transporter, DHA1 family, tetracycline resistance protein